MEQTEEKLIKIKKYNTKLYPIYKMFAWDLLFYYSILFLFLTQTKNFTTSDILFVDAFYPLFKLILQIPCVNIVETFGKRKSLIIGNLFIAACILVVIFAKDIPTMVFSNFLMALGYSIKSLCESSLLSDCITNKEHPGTAFSNVDGKGSAYWYYLDAITSVSCGFLFVFNPYVPMYLCFTMCVISCILSYSFKTYENSKVISLPDGETGSYKEYFHNLRVAFKNIFKSNRLKSLLLFSGTFAALLTVRNTIESSLFTEIQVKEEYFGIIFAILTILSGISSKRQDFFHKRYRNKLLTKFSLSFSISMIIIGLTAIIFKASAVSFTAILFAYRIQYIIKGPYYTLQKRYLNSFSTPSMSTKIYSACTLIESLFNTLIYFVSAFMLHFMPTSTAITILGCVFTIMFIFILDYMKSRIGLKPEEYRHSDIHFTEIH